MSDEQKTQPKVITVTLNPALDRTLTTHFFAPGYTNLTSGATRLDPAGRGVSISRALHTLGIPTHALILVGDDATGRAYQALLAEEQYPISILRRAGRTRSNIHILDTGHNHHTTIREDSDEMVWADRQQVANTLAALINRGDTVVFGGTLPPGVRSDIYALLTSLAQTRGAGVAINAGGSDALEKALPARPMLIYLSQVQAEHIFNFPVRVLEDIVHCARQLRLRGARRVLLGLDNAEVALLATEAGTWLAEWPKMEGNRTGRPEALLAGYLAARLGQASFEDALRLAAASAEYTVSHVGWDFGTPQDISGYLSSIKLWPANTPDEISAAADTWHTLDAD